MPVQDFEAQVERTAKNIQTSDEIHDRNKELLREYHRDQVLNELSDATLVKNLGRLKVMAEHVDKPFDEMTTADVKDLVEWIHSRDYTGETVTTYKNIIKVFWRWLDGDGDEHPPEVSWIKTNGSHGNGTLPTDLLTKADIEAQIAAAKNPRDRALIMMLWESGARIGEVIDLTVGDIEDRKHGKKVVLDGKTGPRRVPLVESVPYLNKWLNSHPNPEKDAPLWCKIQQNGPKGHLNPHEVEDVEQIHGIGPAIAEKLRERGIETGADLLEHSPSDLADIRGVKEGKAKKWFDQFDAEADLTADHQLGYRYIVDKILKRTMDDAGIDKPSNPHHYRHSRASFLATKMTEAELCQFFGWVQGSSTPAKYVHLSGRDLDNTYDAMHGLRDPDEDEDEPDVIQCWRCEELNEPNRRYCGGCGAALDRDAVDELEAAEEETTDDATEEDLKLALAIVDKMKEDREAVREFVEGS